MKARSHGKRRLRRRGSVLLLLVVCLLPLLAVAAVVLDGGIQLNERRHAQSVADMSALAASYSLYNNYSQNSGLDPNGAAKTQALAIAADNGYTNDGTTSTVTVNIPPKSGLFNGQSGYVEVLVKYTQPSYFSAMWGSSTMSVSTRSVARGKPLSGYGVILLDPSMSGALSGTGTARLNVPNGTIAVDSNNSKAAIFTGSAGATAKTINITGGSSNESGAYVGTVNYGTSPTADPLASLAVPSMTGMTVQSSSQLNINTGQSQTIYPGVYTGGINMSGGSLTMMPGSYYINGGGIKTNSSASITGSNVFIYNGGGGNIGSISLTGSSSITVTPPTTGTYKGMSIFQDRTATAAVSLTGSGGINITGGIYAAAAQGTLTGSTSTNVTGSFLILDSAKLTGSSTINVGTGTASGNRDTRIVE